LPEGEADQGHQSVAVEPAPCSPLEVIKPEFFFELLCRPDD
jgi:hypothetical protein